MRSVKFTILDQEKRKKRDLVKHVHHVLNDPKRREQKMTTIWDELQQNQFNTIPIHHNFYRTHFNSIDRHDKIWYSFCYSYKVFNWKTVYFFALVKLSVINAWVLWNDQKKIDLRNYLEIILKWCLKPEFK